MSFKFSQPSLLHWKFAFLIETANSPADHEGAWKFFPLRVKLMLYNPDHTK